MEVKRLLKNFKSYWFPSPIGVIFFLIQTLEEIKEEAKAAFPSPIGVIFFLINEMTLKPMILKVSVSYQSYILSYLTEHGYTVLSFNLAFPSPIGVIFFLIDFGKLDFQSFHS